MAMTYDPTTADPGTIHKIPAGDLLIDPNVRTSIRLDKSFVSSIRVYGFEQYPVGYQDDDGKAHITIGQRRVSAALEIGWPVIPVVIKPRVQAEADRVEELRILTQLAENEHRTGLLESESAGAYKQLALLEVSEEQIARKTNSPKARITTALKVAESATAIAAIEKHELTLDQAAILVEFEADEAAITELRELAAQRPEQIEHAAQRIREDRTRRAEADAKAAELEAAGWEVIREKQEYFPDPRGATRGNHIWREGDKAQKRLSDEELAALEHRVAVVYVSSYRWGWTLYVRNLAQQGLATYASSSGTKSGPLSDEEKAARRQKRTDKAEMTAATVVRREWITEFLQRKHKIHDVIWWIANAAIATPVALEHDQRSRYSARDLTVSFFGLAAGSNVDDMIIAGNDTDRLRILLAYSISLVEGVAGDQRHHSYGQYTQLAPYLLQLQEWGYTLADVEQRIVDAAAKSKKGRK